jgi:hypothetical protein
MDEYVTDNNPVHVIEALVDDLDLAAQGSAGVAPRRQRSSHKRPDKCEVSSDPVSMWQQQHY